jgi:anti-sigma B factor antagonist
MDSSDRAREAGTLSLASTFLASFPAVSKPRQEDRLASVDRVREDGALTLLMAEEGDDSLLIRAVGELDLASAKSLEGTLRQAINTKASSVVLDLDRVSFIDSTGLRTLLRASKLSTMTGSRLRFHRPSSAVKRAIEVAHVEDLLPL